MINLHAWIALVQWYWRKVLRHPVVLSFSFFQPLIWLAFFSFLLQGVYLQAVQDQRSYLDYLLPGVCLMTVLFGASQSGISLIRDMQTQFLQRLLTSPAGTTTVLGAKLTADVSRLLIQAGILFGLGLLLGFQPNIDPIGLLVALLYAILFALFLASISCSIALFSGRQEAMATFVHLVNMPLLFTSTALLPSRRMPDWIAWLSKWNPLSLAVDALRDALLYSRSPNCGVDLLSLFGLTSIMLIVAQRSLSARAIES